MNLGQYMHYNLRPDLTSLTEEQWVEILKREPFQLEYVSNKTTKLCLTAIASNPRVISLLNPSRGDYQELADFTVKCDPNFKIYFIKNEDECYELIKKDVGLCRYTNIKRSDKLCLKVIRLYSSSPNLFLIVKHEHRPKILLEIIKANPLNLRFLKFKQHKPILDFIAVHKNGTMLQYILKQTPELCKNALWDPGARKYAKYGLELPCIYY